MISAYLAPEVQDATVPSAGQFYRPELDAMRFFAFLAVFIHHMRQIYNEAPSEAWAISALATHHSEGGSTIFKNSLSAGVSLFFFLSAYLITTLLVKELDSTGTVHTPSFYVRRGLRIWPLYFAYFTLVVILGVFVPNVRMQPSEALSYIGFVGNWYCTRHFFVTSVLIGPLWSISIEEQFYLFAPVAVKFLRKKGLFLFSLCCIFLSIALLVYFGRRALTADYIVRPNSFVQMLFFGGGTIAALVLRGRVWSASWVLRIVMGTAGVGCWYIGLLTFGAEFDPHAGMFGPLMNYSLVLLGVVLIFFSFLGISAKYVPESLAYLGRVSYGLYVFHMLAYWLVAEFWILPKQHMFGILPRSGVSLALTILFAAISYNWLESPFVRLKKRFTVVTSRAV